jgi:hypothetical protein
LHLWKTLTWFSAAGNRVGLKFTRRRRIRVWHLTTYLIERNGICDRNIWLMIDVVLMNIGSQRQRTLCRIDSVMMRRRHVMRMIEVDGHRIVLICVWALLHRLQLLAITLLAVKWVCLWLYLENFCCGDKK